MWKNKTNGETERKEYPAGIPWVFFLTRLGLPTNSTDSWVPRMTDKTPLSPLCSQKKKKKKRILYHKRLLVVLPLLSPSPPLFLRLFWSMDFAQPGQ